MLKNAAIQQMIGFDIQNLTINKANQLKVFQFAS